VLESIGGLLTCTTALVSIAIPASVTIGAVAFFRCDSLTTVTFAENSVLELLT
jgi:hypothetical protein